jgi:hypothetical protein
VSGPEDSIQPVVRCYFVIEPQDPKLDEKKIRALLEGAKNEAVKAASREHEVSAQLGVPGGFGGVGEIAIAVNLVLPYLKDAGIELTRGTLEAAGAYFFTQYLAPRLRELNLLPSKFRAQPEIAAEAESSTTTGTKTEKHKTRASKKSTRRKKG